MRSSRVFTAFGTGLAVLLAASGVLIWVSTAPEADRLPQVHAAPAVRQATTEQPPSQLSDACKAQLKQVRDAYESIPKNPGSMNAKAADALAQRLITALTVGDKFAASCPQAAEIPQVRFWQAKFLWLLSSRQLDGTTKEVRRIRPKDIAAEIARRMRPFYERAGARAQAAVRGLPKDAKNRPEALEISGWAFTKMGEFAKARDCYLQHRKDYPKNASATTVRTALARVYLDLGEFDAGIGVIEKALQDPDAWDSDSYSHLGEVLWKLHEQKGDPEGMLATARKVLKMYQLRLKSSRLSQKARQDLSRYVDVFGFREGYSHFALGQFQKAADTFRKHIAGLDKRREELRAQNRDLEPTSSIYRDRSDHCLKFVETLAARPAPADLDLGRFWVSEHQPKIATSQGKAIGLVFRGVNDKRSSKFLGPVDKFASKTDGVELVTISYLKDIKGIDQQLTALKDELFSLEYESAAGFDPDYLEKRLFRLYGAFIGSATFIIIDANGHPIWYQQDPRGVDAGLAKELLRRARKQ